MKNSALSFLNWFDTGSTRRDAFVCFCMGAVGALSMAPFYATPILWIVFPFLLRLADKSHTTKHVFSKIFFFHFGFHVAGFYWIAAALMVDIKNNWWALPFSLSALPAFMALYPAAFAAFWHRLGWRGLPRILLLCVLLAFSEWARGTIFGGFPWNLWGYTWVATLPVLQTVSLVGIYGLTFLTLVLAFLPVLLTKHYKQKSGALFALLFVLGLVTLTAWGGGRLSRGTENLDPNFMIRIVQPNIKQEAKWNKEKRDRIEYKLWELTVSPAKTVPHMVIWPETAIALVSTDDLRRHEYNLRRLFWPGAVLAAGIFDVENDPNTNTTRFFNRIGFYNYSGARIDAFDKHHLVPFGEFLPFQEYWPVRPVAFRGGSMTAGPGPVTLGGEWFPPLSAMICYEAIFSGDAVNERDRPMWLLNVTNDGWYGDTTGPYQHLAISQTRAVEEGLPMVRAANTGISAVIDPMGRITARLPLGVEGVIDQPLPAPLKATLFAKFGNTLFAAILLVFGAFAWAIHMFSVRKHDHVA